MRALQIQKFGAPSVLCIDTVATPQPNPGEVLIEVHAGGFNFADTERRRGLYQSQVPLPEVMGFEGSGVVVQLGEGVEASWMKRRVAFTAPRAHAEYAVCPVVRLIGLPDEMDFITGAAFPVQALTAWHALFTMGKLQAGETVCIHSVAGGVGLLATQLALTAGAKVFGTVSDLRKAEAAEKLGATVVLRGPHYGDAIRGATQGQGVNVLLDAVGRDVFEDGPTLLAPLGRWIIYGTASGPPPKLDLESLYEKSLSISCYWFRTLIPNMLWERAVNEVMQGFSKGTLRTTVSETFEFHEAERAHEMLERGRSIGKLVLKIRS
jgi:NADPH:quinone reductase